jgi:hypothetical protein
MDTDTLVEERIDIGQKLITLLAEIGFHVAAACWIKPYEDDRWFLYIASEEVDRLGLAEAYRKVHGLFRSTQQQDWDLSSAVKLIRKDNPIARDILKIQERFPTNKPTRSRKIQLAGISSDEVYIYPPLEGRPVGSRLSYRVTYHRQGKTNAWRARTKKDATYRGMRAKGAVAYSTALWEGEKEGDEDHATVSVLLEVDPNFDDENPFLPPDVWKLLKSQARQMADEMFKSRHPDAVIEHGEED